MSGRATVKVNTWYRSSETAEQLSYRLLVARVGRDALEVRDEAGETRTVSRFMFEADMVEELA